MRNTKSIRGVRVVVRRRGKKFCYYALDEHTATQEEIDRQIIDDIVNATSELYDLDYAK